MPIKQQPGHQSASLGLACCSMGGGGMFSEDPSEVPCNMPKWNANTCKCLLNSIAKPQDYFPHSINNVFTLLQAFWPWVPNGRAFTEALWPPEYVGSEKTCALHLRLQDEQFLLKNTLVSSMQESVAGSGLSSNIMHAIQIRYMLAAQLRPGGPFHGQGLQESTATEGRPHKSNPATLTEAI